MAVIKSLDLTFGHLYNGRLSPEMSVNQAIGMIKSRKERRESWGEVEYVGEKGIVDVDITKVECEDCKLDLRIELGAERKG